MTIESDIITWGLERPRWQQETLVALANGDQFDLGAIRDLCARILAGTHTAPSTNASSLAVKSAVVEQVTLAHISDVRGVNALIEDQQLNFGATGVTVVYGDNGSGKSGYARLVKALVNARHSSEILPNVFMAATQAPSGSLHYRVSESDKALAFPATPPPELLKMSFYDEHCGDEYLTKESSISYRPSALILLDGLIRVCDDVRNELAVRIKENEAATLSLNFPKPTHAHTFVSTLTDATTVDQVDAAAALPPDNSTRLAAALSEEARLAASSPEKEKARLATLATHLRTLGQDLQALIKAVGTEEASRLEELRSVAKTAREAAKLAATGSFDDQYLPGVGSETWRVMWRAARDYSTTEAYQEHQFPVLSEDAICVLCQQPLADSAKERMQHFDEYMTDTTERDAVAAESAFDESLGELRTLRIDTSGRTTALVELEEHDKQLSADARALLAKIDERRQSLVNCLTGGDLTISPLPEVVVTAQLLTTAATLQQSSENTDVIQFNETLQAVRGARIELQAQERLSESVEQIKGELSRRFELRALKAARSAADTSSITQKAAFLTRQYATDRILDQFTRETERLGLQRVTLEDLGGRKGQLNQKPGLLGATRGVGARKVLSEGEQTALGLAGFFTETVFDESKSAIILDDPVTSLDHMRRDRVATRLAQLAQDRQVIVFTHDVAFAGDLLAAAKSEGVALSERCIERRGVVPGMCRDAFPWKAKDFASRVDHLSNTLTKLKKDRPDLVQEEWEERVATWAGYLSETWERSVTTEIMNEVFDRSKSEVRMMKFRILTAITTADDQELQEGYSATSRWGRRHDKAVETNYIAPEPADLQHELERLIRWQKRVKGYRS